MLFILRMRPRALLRSVLVLLILSPSAFAWNALGHKVVAEIAWRQIEPSTRQQIVDTIRRHPRFDADFAAKMTDDVLRGDKLVQDRWIFQHAAYWPDIARGLPAGERGTYNRPTWHYVNFPLFLDAEDRQALEARLSVNISAEYPSTINADNYNVLQAITHCRTALASDAGADVKALAYCWLFHLIGDLHQPLHSTALFSKDHFPNGDRGGNEIPLVRGQNLHSLWDNLLGRQHFMRNVDREVAELSDRDRYGDVWDSAPKETNPRSWAAENYEICKSFAYDAAIIDAVRATTPGTKQAPILLPESYYKLAGDYARRRIIAAGLRLAAVLRQIRPT